MAAYLADEAVAHLGALVDKNLVQFDDTGTGPARYRLLETVRQYTARQLERQGPAAAHDARTAHRDHYLALAQSAAPQLIAHDQAAWLDLLDLELDNLRAATAFSLAQPDPASGLQLVTALRVFWKARGHATEGVDALRALLAAPAAPGATLLRARALAAAAYLLDQTGGYALADDYCEEALAIARLRRRSLPDSRPLVPARLCSATPGAAGHRAAAHRGRAGPGAPTRGTASDRQPPGRPGVRRGRRGRPRWRGSRRC